MAPRRSVTRQPTTLNSVPPVGYPSAYSPYGSYPYTGYPAGYGGGLNGGYGAYPFFR